jgi:hypothetical protein
MTGVRSSAISQPVTCVCSTRIGYGHSYELGIETIETHRFRICSMASCRISKANGQKIETTEKSKSYEARDVALIAAFVGRDASRNVERNPRQGARSANASCRRPRRPMSFDCLATMSRPKFDRPGHGADNGKLCVSATRRSRACRTASASRDVASLVSLAIARAELRLWSRPDRRRPSDVRGRSLGR